MAQCLKGKKVAIFGDSHLLRTFRGLRIALDPTFDDNSTQIPAIRNLKACSAREKIGLWLLLFARCSDMLVYDSPPPSAPPSGAKGPPEAPRRALEGHETPWEWICIH